MTVNPRTNAVELTPVEVRKAIALYLREKLQIDCSPNSVEFLDEAAVVTEWSNEPVEEDMFLINS